MTITITYTYDTGKMSDLSYRSKQNCVDRCIL